MVTEKVAQGSTGLLAHRAYEVRWASDQREGPSDDQLHGFITLSALGAVAFFRMGLRNWTVLWRLPFFETVTPVRRFEKSATAQARNTSEKAPQASSFQADYGTTEVSRLVDYLIRV